MYELYWSAQLPMYLIVWHSTRGLPNFHELRKGQTCGRCQYEHPEPDLWATPCPRTWRHSTVGPRSPWWQAAVGTFGSGGAPSSLNYRPLTISNVWYQYFDRFWLDEINAVKIVNDHNSNKLHFYSTLKSSFSREPYFDLVQSRNQPSFLTKLRCSAHHPEIEKLRYSKPSIPPSLRTCGFCDSGQIGDEVHFVMIYELLWCIPNSTSVFHGKN